MVVFRPKIGQFSKFFKILSEFDKTHRNTLLVQKSAHLKHFWPFYGHSKTHFGPFFLIYKVLPYNKSVLTNIGKVFLGLLERHFPPGHKYHSIFNKQTVKISYSCCPSVQSAISAHNRKLLRNSISSTTSPPASQPPQLCNCKSAEVCPMSGSCLKSAIIYKATVSSEVESKFYIRATEQTFKKRYPKHKDALQKKESKESTSLSTYVWNLRDLNQEPTIKWEVIRQCMPYTCGSRRCDICLSEKLCILESDENCINKNTELMQKCRHSNKFKLKNIGKRKNV